MEKIKTTLKYKKGKLKIVPNKLRRKNITIYDSDIAKIKALKEIYDIKGTSEIIRLALNELSASASGLFIGSNI